jgi:hypothetical protein
VRLTISEIFAHTGDVSLVSSSGDRGAAREVVILEPKDVHADFLELPSDLESDWFSIAGYRDLLTGALAAGYRFIGFEEAIASPPSDDQKLILLRHDIDLSPTLALRIAEFESAMGIHSTFFFMISGAFYDLFEPRNRRVVQAMIELGHTVGLHYDEYDDIAEGLDLLSVLAGRKLRHIAQHNPTLLPRRGLERHDVVDAYDPRIQREQGFTYVSDSGMRFRKATIADHVSGLTPRIYALCHPETWLTEGGDLISMIRNVERDEVQRMRRRYDEFVAGNIRYLRARREREGR